MRDKENYISRGIKLDLDFVPERNGKYFLLMKKQKSMNFLGHNFVANSGFEIPNFE